MKKTHFAVMLLSCSAMLAGCQSTNQPRYPEHRLKIDGELNEWLMSERLLRYIEEAEESGALFANPLLQRPFKLRDDGTKALPFITAVSVTHLKKKRKPSPLKFTYKNKTTGKAWVAAEVFFKLTPANELVVTSEGFTRSAHFLSGDWFIVEALVEMKDQPK